MKLRKGRLNVIKFVNEEVVHKIGIVKEESRPFRLKIEGWALSQARKRGANTPQVIDYFHNLEGQEVLVLKRIDGKTLLRHLSQENKECFLNVGTQMALLNNISNKYGWIGPDSMCGSHESWRSFILQYLKNYGGGLVKVNLLPEEHLQKVYKIFDNVELNLLNSYLVNRDIKPSNILRDNMAKVWILDWEDVMLGDPLFDIAIFGVRYGHGPLWKHLIEGYKFDVSVPKYSLYEIMGLIGLIDFYRKEGIGYGGRQKQLLNLISRTHIYY